MFSKRIAWTAVPALLVLAACGGGGSSGGSSPPPPPPPPPPGVTVTAANAADVAITGAGIIEAGAQLALAAVNPIIELLETGGTQFDRTCGGGTLNVTVTDNDGDGALSDGDSANVAYDNGCFSAELDSETTGTMQFDVSDVAASEVGNAVILRGTLTFPGAFSVGQVNTVDVSGTLEIAAIMQGRGLFEVLQIVIPPGGELSFDISAGGTTSIERASALNLRRFVEGSTGLDPTYTLTTSATIESELLGGDIECVTTMPLFSSDVNEEPTAGQLDCTGLSGSTARLDSNRPQEGAPIDLLVDSEGDGNFVSVGNLPTGPPRWGNFVEGALFAERVRSASIPQLPGPTQLDPLSLSVTVNQVIHAPLRNRLIATTPAGIVEIDPLTMTVLQEIPVAGSPGALALSDDETTLWIALDDTDEIQRFSYPALVAGSAYPLGESSVVAGERREVFQLEVAPGTTDLVVLSTRRFEEMVAFANGVELPNLINSAVISDIPPRSFAFRDATRIVGVVDTSTGYNAYRISLDPATGLTVEATLPGLSDQLRGRLKIGTDDVFVTGRVFNEITESVEARIEPADGLAFFYSDIQVNAAADRVYGISGRIVDVYDENAFVHVGRHEAASNPSATLLTPDYLVFVTPSAVERYTLSDIQPNFPSEPCSRTDVSDLWTAGTCVQLVCDIREATYDPVRDRIYAALPNFTDRGNSVAVIDPETLSIIDYVPVGGTPKSLKISDDGATLFAILDQTSKIVEIDIDTLMVTDITTLGFESTRPYLAVDLAPTTEAGAEFVAILNNRIGLLGGGTTIGSISPFSGRSWDQIFATEDGGTAITRGFNSVGAFGISASGVSTLSEQSEVASPRRSEQRGDFFYEGRGTRLDFATRSVEDVCSVPPIAAQFNVRVGPDLTSELVYYGAFGTNRSSFAGEEFRVVACDPATSTPGAVKSEFAYEVREGDLLQLLPVSGNRMAILTTTHMVLLDRPAL